MKPDISEFSYGYAVVDELIHWHGTSITVAPIFSSLYQEGKPGGGWDAQLDKGGIPLFLQFKLSDWMKAKSAKERKKKYFKDPYYRMYVRKRNHSNQHQMLLDLETKGHEVYYVAPAFHQPHELDFAYINHKVKTNSIWIRPSVIGALVDDKQHYVAFRLPTPLYWCSEPKEMPGDVGFQGVSSRIQGRLNEVGSSRVKRESLEKLAVELEDISRNRKKITLDESKVISSGLADRHPIERVAYYAATYFDSQLLLIQPAGE